MEAPLTHACPVCGEPLPDGAPEGLCPRCLMVQAMEPTLATASGGGRHAAPALDVVRTTFPQLEVLELIGEGGMGAVYKARQPQLDRLVALKILNPRGVPDSRFAERFQREARALARLSHPNIVTVHDFGQAGEFFYLLMEYVDGVNLRQAMMAGRFSGDQALAIVPPICEALQYAHEHGIVHRDIKPENLLLSKEGRVKIADFGIARLLDPASEEARHPATGLTQESAIGTPEYMAPEQSRGSGEVDHRADIYSLGVVLYEMLTGELPVSKIERPSSLGQGGVQIDVRLDAIVLRALDFRPERRYRTAMELKTEVEGMKKRETATNHMKTPPSHIIAQATRFVVKWVVLPLAAMLLAALITHLLLPTEYYAESLADVKPDNYSELRNNPFIQLQSAAQGFYFDRQFIATEAEIIRRREIFDRVMKVLPNLGEPPGTESPARSEEQFMLYRRSVAVSGVPKTSVLRIGVYHTNRDLPAQLANAILVSYRNFRLEELQAQLERKLSPLQNEVTKQRKIVVDAGVEISRLRQKDQIADPDPDIAGVPVASPTANKEALTAYSDAKTLYIQSRKILQNAEESLSKARMELMIDVDPVKVIERAPSPARKSSFSPRRLIARLLGAAN